MDKAEILALLHELGDELAKEGHYAVLDIYGGSAIALSYIDSRVSYDIDCMVTHATSHERLREVVAAVGQRHGLNHDWLNEDIAPIITRDMFGGNTSVFGKTEGLEIRVPEPEFMLACKLYAARMNKADLDDALMLSRRLGIATRNGLERVLRRYVREDAIKEQNRRPKRHNCIWKFMDRVSQKLNEPQDS